MFGRRPAVGRTINNLDFIVFDFETGGLQADFHEAIQIAGKAYNARTLEPYPVSAGGEFESLMKPLHPERLQAEALKVNGKTVDQLMAAPDQKLVWNQFVDWVGKYNPTKSSFKAPIAAGKNIRNFDLKFVDVLNEKHCKNKAKTVLFNTRMQLELEDIFFFWFENEAEPKNAKLDTLREFFGMGTDGAHDALVDVRQTGDLIMKFLKLHRELQRRTAADGSKLIKFKDSFRRKAA